LKIKHGEPFNPAKQFTTKTSTVSSKMNPQYSIASSESSLMRNGSRRRPATDALDQRLLLEEGKLSKKRSLNEQTSMHLTDVLDAIPRNRDISGCSNGSSVLTWNGRSSENALIFPKIEPIECLMTAAEPLVGENVKTTKKFRVCGRGLVRSEAILNFSTTSSVQVSSLPKRNTSRKCLLHRLSAKSA